jgi:phosphopantothenoylcysteine decarboxylase/phosphopantothenate--cysteine ligase
MSEPTGRLKGRRIALGITGSIAVYKAVELLRLLQAEGADVRVLMTHSAKEFIGTLTLETLSRHPVDSDVLALQADGKIGHIDTAHDVEAIVVAPATAHWMAAMATGMAGDSITAACLATIVPVIVAPAMDAGMYSHPATAANVARLTEFGYRIVEPELGPLASGMVGRGRLAALSRIVDATVETLANAPARPSAAGPAEGASWAPPGAPDASDPGAILPPVAAAPSRRDLAGRHVVITAGGTAEAIDPVRFFGNRSTGKMGVAIAEDALDRGAAVTLILGQSTVQPPAGAHVARVDTAAEMQAALRALTPPSGPVFDVLIMAAAVADFRPKNPAGGKLKRGEGLTLELEATPDLLAEASQRVRTGVRASGGLRPVLVGFAAETGSTERAAEKVAAKGVDMLVANDVTEPGSGFGTDTNHVIIYYPDGAPENLPMLTKREVAELILDRILIRLDSRVPADGEQAAEAPAAEEPAAVAPAEAAAAESKS